MGAGRLFASDDGLDSSAGGGVVDEVSDGAVVEEDVGGSLPAGTGASDALGSSERMREVSEVGGNREKVGGPGNVGGERFGGDVVLNVPPIFGIRLTCREVNRNSATLEGGVIGDHLGDVPGVFVEFRITAGEAVGGRTNPKLAGFGITEAEEEVVKAEGFEDGGVGRVGLIDTAAEGGGSRDRGRIAAGFGAGEMVAVVDGVHLQGEANLGEIGAALDGGCRLTGLGEYGEKDPDQDSDDPDDHEEFDKGESSDVGCAETGGSTRLGGAAKQGACQGEGRRLRINDLGRHVVLLLRRSGLEGRGGRCFTKDGGVPSIIYMNHFLVLFK